MPLRIEDYALIGDCQTAALVARDGSIDWLCLPRFDSGTCFAALLGTPEHGRWLIAPVGGVRKVNRHYRPGTLVLETVFETEDGEVAVIDFMPPRSQVPELIRVVEGRRGRVPMHLELVIRFDYGSIIPWVRHRRPTALSANCRPRPDSPAHLRRGCAASTIASAAEPAAADAFLFAQPVNDPTAS